MTNTQFEAEVGRRAELREANERALTYLDEEIEPGDRLPRETFDEEAKDDQALARSLFAVLLRELGLDSPDDEEFPPYLAASLMEDMIVTPRALHQALDARGAKRVPRRCETCGAPKDQKAA